MRRFAILLLVVLIAFESLEFSDAARGRGGGGKSGGSSGKSGSSSRSKSKSSRGSGSRSKSSKITKYTPIKATKASSPVIVSQTKLGSRSNTFTKALAGYVVLRYTLHNARIYRQGYPMYGSYVTIPKERAVRISYEEEKLLDADGNLCLGHSKTNYTLREGIAQHLAEMNTTVRYKRTGENKTYYVDTISLDDIKEEDFEVTSRVRYNTTIINGTSCTQVEKIVSGTMVTMYETNPNTASTAQFSNKLLVTIIALFAIYSRA